ncbi:ribosomal RNA processing protein 36 homolog [Antennarius striatus]|uniref:ribosomal RNA processing protein 36 homolog n=1 Tax=Antennarius striatus TaxID=241820 RepID=UPI0035AD9A63
MKGKQRRQRGAEPDVAPSGGGGEEEESDLEKNSALLAERGGAEEEERQSGEQEEESDADEVEEGGGASASHDDDDDDEGPEDGGGDSQAPSELSRMSFEDILELQRRVGTKAYNLVAHGNHRGGATRARKRLNKNRPLEVSAKKPVPFLRQVVAVKKPACRDPRFDDLSGEFSADIFEKTYGFVSDIRQKEKEVVQKQLKKTKRNGKRKEKLQLLLKRMEDQDRERKRREQQRERELQFKRQQRERANQGARPFFLKKSEKKKLQLAEKYEQLKTSGKLERFLSRKRKRNAAKDRRKLPGKTAP